MLKRVYPKIAVPKEMVRPIVAVEFSDGVKISCCSKTFGGDDG